VQAKFSYCGSILGLSQFTLLPSPAASINEARFKSDQNQLENNNLPSLT